MRTSEFSRPDQQWLTEAVRQLETDAWLDDKSILQTLARTNIERGLDTEGLILERTRLLAGNHPIVADLAEEMRRVRSGGSLLMFALAVLASVGGLTTAAAVLRGQAVNVVLAWSALLGVHLVTLLLWCLASFFPGKGADLANHPLWGSIVRRLFAGRQRLVLLRAALALTARTRFVYWFYSLISHVLWSLFFVSAALALTYLFALHEYSFKWETTILPATFFVRFVEVFAWLPQQLGLRMPTPAVVTSLLDDTMTRQAWAGWMLACVVLYGLLPRLLLAALSGRQLAKLGRELRLDLDLAYYVKLRQRLDSLLRPATKIVDAAPNHAESPHLFSQSGEWSSGQTGLTVRSLIFGFELADDVPWPPAALPSGIVVGANFSTGEERDQLLHMLGDHPPRRLLAACDARAGVDRGTLYFFRDVARHAAEFAVVLLKQDHARAGRAANWREELLALGVAEQTIFADLAAATKWLEDGDV